MVLQSQECLVQPWVSHDVEVVAQLCGVGLDWHSKMAAVCFCLLPGWV